MRQTKLVSSLVNVYAHYKIVRLIWFYSLLGRLLALAAALITTVIKTCNRYLLLTLLFIAQFCYIFTQFVAESVVTVVPPAGRCHAVCMSRSNYGPRPGVLMGVV